MKAKTLGYTLDSGVLIEYVTPESPNYTLARNLLLMSLLGRVKLYVQIISLTEVYYVSLRLYKTMGLKQPGEKARALFNFYINHPGINIVVPDSKIALEAGVIKENYKISLADSYVLATAKNKASIPLFRKVEEEFKEIYGELKKAFRLTTLQEIKTQLEDSLTTEDENS